MTPWRLVPLALLLAASVSGQERVLGDGAPEAAEQRYQIGVEAYRAGRYPDAAREFRVALELAPGSPVLTYNLARSLERAGDLDGAITHYFRYLEIAPSAKDWQTVKNVVEALVAERERRAGKLQVSSIPDAAAVFVDNERSAARGRTPLTLKLMPGEHTVRVTLDGYRPVERAVKIATGKSTSVALELMPLDDEAGGGLRTAGWVVGGVGVAAVLVGGVFHGLAARTRGEGDELGVGEQAARAELQDELEGRRTAMWVGYGVGVGLLAVSAALLLWPDDAPATAAVGPSGISVGGTW